MTKNPVVPIPGFDLTFRPSTYFWPLPLETHLLASIKGAERKAMVEELIRTGRLDEIPDELARSKLSEEHRNALGRIHPALMGGEYLPNLRQAEVEIVRITLASVTQDVISVFARRGGHRIHYRVVDEYGGELLCAPTKRTSIRPLSLGELEAFFTNACSLFDILEMNFGAGGSDVDDALTFTRATSPFYPQFTSLYERRVEAWVAERKTALGLDEAESDLEQE